VGGEEDRAATRLLVADQRAHQGGVDRIEPGGRLVEEQHLRVVQQGPREVEPHPHALRVAGDRGVRGRGEPDRREHRAGITERPRVQAAEVGEVLASGQARVADGELEGHPDAVVEVGPPRPDRPTEDLDGARPPGEEPDERPLRGGLAGSARSEEPEHLARPDREAHAVDRGRVAPGS
jgi:hypothetical protein